MSKKGGVWLRNKKTLSIILIAILLISITGCSGPDPKETVEAYLETVKKGELEESEKYLVDGGSGADEDNDLDEESEELLDEISNNIFSKIEYELSDSEVDGDKAKVEAKITAPDLEKVFYEVFGDSFMMTLMEFMDEEGEIDEEELEKRMMDKFKNILNKEDLETVTQNVKINLEKKENEWLIVMDDDLLNALSGNLFSTIDLLTQ